LASCVVTGTSDGSILVYDVRVGRGSSGLKAVTSLHNAHSEEVHINFPLTLSAQILYVKPQILALGSRNDRAGGEGMISS
jgi:hypothetical protein